jgi:hypothetical protein
VIKKILKIFSGILLLAVPVFIAGPRTEMDETLHPVDIPNDFDRLEQHIAQSETAINCLQASLVKGIVWADRTQKSRTPMALVYIHGFSVSRNEVMPLCDSLAAGLGANLFYTRLNRTRQRFAPIDSAYRLVAGKYRSPQTTASMGNTLRAFLEPLVR